MSSKFLNDKLVKQVCSICPHRCALSEGQTGLCRARTNTGGTITCNNYGKLTSLCFDPIEKKPFARFYPGSMILSVGSYGCNFHCPFCQNSHISMADSHIGTSYVSPELLVQKALALRHKGNIGIAFTYNEPMIGYEYLLDAAREAKQVDLKALVVTNGFICEDALLKLLPYIDAFNIDLKAFKQDFYTMIGGNLQIIKNTISLAAKYSHVEVTSLIIPDMNDSENEIEMLSAWLASVNKSIPLHISRFYPAYKMNNLSPTDVAVIYRLRDRAAKFLDFVYTGNC